ncbi:hypothetical protein PVK06_030434 [Gossypium arboreum]|uniref:Gag-pro-like protein n=1 Tax=Gossypium arboreum TaxID=29729 RepID=A0ABR0NPC9_GOSAR|nr:hypothetical protein PVK06_030434 [Gossypium arboreum]
MLVAQVAKLEKALHQCRGYNFDIELRASLSRIEDLKGKDMRDQMLESQRNMMNQLTQLLVGGPEKGKSPMINTGDDSEDLLTLQTGTSAPINFPTGSCSNPEDNRANPIVPDLNDIAKAGRARAELAKQLEDLYKWLEEKFKALESVDYHCGVGAKELSLVPDLVLPPKFKISEFEKYNGTSCPKAYITMFCRGMTGYVNNDQLLIHRFQDSLTRATAKWYNQLNHTQVKSWKDLAQAFMKQYGHVMDIAPDRIKL